MARLLRCLGGVLLCVMAACQWGEPSDSRLGRRINAIIGGKADARHPAVGTLTINKGGQFCTGTLVAPQLVLTAAHCITAAQGHIKAKRKVHFRIDTPSAATKQTFHEVQSVQVHPKYKKSSSGVFHDVGVAILKAKVPGVTPMRLHTSPMDQSWRNRKVLFLGYGLIQTKPKRQGTKVKQGIEIAIRQVIADRFETYEQGKSICSGDSGGPAMYVINNVTRVVGVNSYVQGTQTNNQPNCDGSGFSFRVDVYMDWLRPLLAQYGYVCQDKADCGPCHSCAGGKCQDRSPAASKQLCQPCASPADCGGSGSICVRTPAGNRCMQGCATSGCCPNGYQCTQIGIGTRQCTPPELACPSVKCAKNADCGPGEVCQSGSCKPAPVSPDAKLCKACKQDADCPAKGTCAQYTEGRYCTQPCAADNFCPAGYACEDTRANGRQCVPKAGFCGCQQTSDCQAPFTCEQGQCKIKGGGKTGHSCDASRHPCATGFLCVRSWDSTVSRCVKPCLATAIHPNGQPGSLCRDNLYCDLDAQCTNIQGGKRACLRQCSTSSDCPNGGRCYAQGNASFCFCQSDKECKNGMTCNKSALGNIGLCAPNWPTKAAACGAGEACSSLSTDSQFCAPKGTGDAGIECSPFKPCVAGMLCLRTNNGKAYCFPDCDTQKCAPAGGSCVRAGANRACTCNASARCGTGYFCRITTGNGGACAKGDAPSCQHDWECSATLVCRQAKCVKDPNPPCRSQADCGLRQRCINGRCTTPPPVPEKNPEKPVASEKQGEAPTVDSGSIQDAGSTKEASLPDVVRNDVASRDSTGNPRVSDNIGAMDKPEQDTGVVSDTGAKENVQGVVEQAPTETAAKTTCGCQTPASGAWSSWPLFLLCLLPLFRRRQKDIVTPNIARF